MSIFFSHTLVLSSTPVQCKGFVSLYKERKLTTFGFMTRLSFILGLRLRRCPVLVNHLHLPQGGGALFTYLRGELRSLKE